ncbi:hypothetical protein [Streptomyces sp. GbtcB6]|uniref:hypothetical protein n=1 Tax=Streptomyces sp. GbtcB6 TaxID=2824751 RepID=UPI001C2F6D18|nr:hypothetical protein [Streptomyces sp. GbtcB6]
MRLATCAHNGTEAPGVVQGELIRLLPDMGRIFTPMTAPTTHGARVQRGDALSCGTLGSSCLGGVPGAVPDRLAWARRRSTVDGNGR